jgi:hypothetical protein
MSRRKAASEPFFQRYLRGELEPDAIDDFVDAWHENPGNRTVFEFLGMTSEEYALWLRDPDALPQIARARKEKLPRLA